MLSALNFALNVTTATPMKRGLKGPRYTLFGLLRNVTTATPMKRGLKVEIRSMEIWGQIRYNRYPDEKGTERVPPTLDGRPCQVTTATPMKRGLKVIEDFGIDDSNGLLQPLPR